MKQYLFVIGLIAVLLFAGCAGSDKAMQDKAMAEKKAMEQKAMEEKNAMAAKKAMEEKAMKEKAMAEKEAMVWKAIEDGKKLIEDGVAKGGSDGIAMIKRGVAMIEPVLPSDSSEGSALIKSGLMMIKEGLASANQTLNTNITEGAAKLGQGIESEEKMMMEKNESGKMVKNSSNGSMMEKSGADNEEAMGKAAYVDYDAAKYQKALAEHKVVYLEFHADWCPTCRAYEPRLLQAFETMAADAKYKDVVGFKVNYDTQTDLEQQFGIVGQHTHIIIGKDGKVVVQSREIWSSQDLIDNIAKAL